MHASRQRLDPIPFPAVVRNGLETLQVNLGYLCNLSCVHCHVNAGPRRTEIMARETVDHVLRFLRASGAETLDLTGGAPEMNPHFRYLVDRARAAGVYVIDRCNLTILEQPEYDDMAAYLADRQVEIIASLPCYLEENVDKQRGKGVFGDSIRALQRLNRLGYGEPGGLTLNLVFNPQGPVLPPPQQPLEEAYHRHLHDRFGIRFTRLYTLANMPIERFGSMLVSKGKFDAYMKLLRDNHDPVNLDSVMCRSTLSVDWQGYVYDCDFNQMLEIPVGANGTRTHITQFDAGSLRGRPVAVRGHCYGCTAGQGSSCGGALKS